MPRTLLAIHAHPDDESSKGAATVAKYVSQGVRAVLVTVTGGEAGDVLNPEMDRPEVVENLAAVRAKELAAAAAIIGYDTVTMLGYRDSGMSGSEANARPDAFCQQPFNDVLEHLVRVVRSERPDVVLGYDAHEFYPHPDHIRVHELSMALVEAAADESRFTGSGTPWQIAKLYAPVFTFEGVVAIHEAMLETLGDSPFSSRVDRMGTIEYPDRKLARIEVAGFIEQGRDALRAHRTQVDPDGFWFAAPTSLVESVYPWENFEVLYSEIGWTPGEDDLFHGLE